MDARLVNAMQQLGDENLLELDKAGMMESFFRTVAADQGGDHLERAREELAVLKTVRLPEKHRDQGPKSADILLQLRCEALREGRDKPGGGPGEDS